MFPTCEQVESASAWGDKCMSALKRLCGFFMIVIIENTRVIMIKGVSASCV